MTRMTPLLGRNEQFARTYTPAALGLPTAQGQRLRPRVRHCHRRVTTTVDARYP